MMIEEEYYDDFGESNQNLVLVSPSEEEVTLASFASRKAMDDFLDLLDHNLVGRDGKQWSYYLEEIE